MKTKRSWPLLALILFSVSAHAAVPLVQKLNSSASFANAVTATGAQAAVALAPAPREFGASMIVTSGSGSASITIEATLDGTFWQSIGTLTVSDTAGDSIYDNSRYAQYRANVTAISGTGAAVSVYSGQ